MSNFDKTMEVPTPQERQEATEARILTSVCAAVLGDRPKAAFEAATLYGDKPFRYGLVISRPSIDHYSIRLIFTEDPNASLNLGLQPGLWEVAVDVNESRWRIEPTDAVTDPDPQLPGNQQIRFPYMLGKIIHEATEFYPGD